MHLHQSFFVIFSLVIASVLSTYLPSYDIWNDGAKIKKNPDSRSRKKATDNRMDPLKTVPHNKTQQRGGKSLAMLNFFSFGTEDECLAEDGRRSGLCMNPYSCRRQDGTSSGYCAHGFGVCCLFIVTCGSEIKNNITYFVSPQFPSLARSLDSCTVMIKKMDAASQLRLDFVHFNLGQPNRLTGDCDSDAFIMAGGNSKDLKLCGLNSNQHVYYDIDKSVSRVTINMRLVRPNLNRIWEIKISQIPFAQRAPAGCLQYYTEKNGFIQTLNYAENGRHLANQDYKACVKPARRMCSIAYEPCDSGSFRIGQNAALEALNGNGGMIGAPGFSGSPGSPGSFGGAGSEIPGAAAQDQLGADGINPDELAGSGDGAVPIVDNNQVPSSRQFTRWSPYAQHLGGDTNGEQLWRYWGYGNYGYGVSSFGRQRCQDRIITPCDGDEFIAANSYSPGVCDPFHCGSSLCPDLRPGDVCRVETSVKPFGVTVKFGPPTAKSNPEDNIGVCLKYEQLPCSE